MFLQQSWYCKDVKGLECGICQGPHQCKWQDPASREDLPERRTGIVLGIDTVICKWVPLWTIVAAIWSTHCRLVSWNEREHFDISSWTTSMSLSIASLLNYSLMFQLMHSTSWWSVHRGTARWQMILFKHYRKLDLQWVLEWAIQICKLNGTIQFCAVI